MGMFTRSVTVLFLLLALNIEQGMSLYFSQTEQQISSNRLTTIDKPYKVKVLLDWDDSGNVLYSISPNIKKCPDLVIDESNGNVKYKHRVATGNLLPGTCSYTISAKLKGAPGNRNNSIATMTLTISEESSECGAQVQESLCFNGMNKVDIQVLENNKVKLLMAKFGEEMSKCGARELKYTVVVSGNEPEVLFVEEKLDGESYELWVKANMDREYMPFYNFTLQCSWIANDGKRNESVKIPGQLTVLDEDDNGPLTQDNTNFEIYDISFLDKYNEFKPGKQIRTEESVKLVVVDMDTKDVNKYTLTTVNDTWKLLNLETSIFPNPYHLVDGTGVFLRIFLTQQADTIKKPWSGRYCVEAILNDTTLVRGPATPIMKYLICLHWGESHANAAPSQIVHTTSVCGDACITYLAIAIVVCVFALCGAVICWKTRYFHSKRRKCPPVKPGGLLGHSIIGGEDYPDHMSTIPEDYLSPNNNGVGMNASHNDMYMMLDPKWEVPRSALTIDGVLGEGEFGRVLKARLKGPEPEQAYTHVAIKMLKGKIAESGKTSRQEFMSEFVLLKQVDHPNVIKLVGSCTSPGGPLYLILEYAELGCLRSFLRKCRKIDNMDEHNLSGDEVVSSIPQDLSEYAINPNEILGFSWQIAKGMAYLSDMKMVHRDLAARNILVTGSKVCKISDFGLTRDIYVDDAYKKTSKGKVPVKWLAPECLADALYTTKSDVWAYGVLLWELATLGANPYPGVSSDQIYPLLKSGYRMEQPQNCSLELYNLMRVCWATDPQNRPTFREIGQILSQMLEEGIDYLKLDIPLVSNPGYQCFGNPQETQWTLADQTIPEALENTRLINEENALQAFGENGVGLSQVRYTNILPTSSNYDTSSDNMSTDQNPSPEESKSYESPIKKTQIKLQE